MRRADEAIEAKQKSSPSDFPKMPGQCVMQSAAKHLNKKTSGYAFRFIG
jgi:hypothetical protein